MKNWEFYEEELKKYNLAFAMKDNQICSCASVPCNRCAFNMDESRTCNVAKVKWLYQEHAEYTEPEIDWSKVAVDTPIMVSINNIDWFCRHFAKYEDGLIYVWDDGKTSYTIDVTSCWNYAKLAEKVI